MTLFWDRQNKPIKDTLVWARMYEDTSYRVVAVDQDGPDMPMVSTIWEGLDRAVNLHADDDTAMIFETAYLVNGQVQEAWLAHSEQEALVQHDWACMKFLGRHSRPEDALVELIVKNERESKK